jgi:hypothetical protein
MLISEIRRWHWAITWDNPDPANSSTMLHSLKRLGHVTRIQTKTTVLLAPRKGVEWRDIRRVIADNLHPMRGNAFYANLRSRRAFQYGTKTHHRWRRVG